MNETCKCRKCNKNPVAVVKTQLCVECQKAANLWISAFTGGGIKDPRTKRKIRGIPDGERL